MSFRVAVLPEDPTHNGYLLKPLVGRLMAACDRPNARVTVITNPRATGYEHAKSLLEDEIIERYGHVDLLLFMPDADGHDRADEFTRLERLAADRHVRLLCCAAVQEVEAWLLAGHPDRLTAPWPEIRADVDVKENYFLPFMQRFGDPRRPGHGRGMLMTEALRRFDGMKTRCPELVDFEQRIRARVGA